VSCNGRAEAGLTSVPRHNVGINGSLKCWAGYLFLMVGKEARTRAMQGSVRGSEGIPTTAC
jgi:hypothetical protein